MALDTQGAEVVRPFSEGTEASFSTLVDPDNLLGQAFGFKVVPNGLMVNASGMIDAMVIGGFDIRRPESRELVEAWQAGRDVTSKPVEENAARSQQARDLFQQASIALKRGDRPEAVRLLKLASPHEPDNYIIRKQLWALEHPDRFYAGEIDLEWQRQQLDKD